MTLESSLILVCFENNVQLLLSICLLSLELHISNEIARNSILKEVFFRFLTQFWENCRFSKSKKWTMLKLHYDLSKDILFISDSRYKSNFWNTFTWFLKDLGSPIPLVVVCLTSNAQFVHCEKKLFPDFTIYNKGR